MKVLFFARFELEHSHMFKHGTVPGQLEYIRPPPGMPSIVGTHPMPPLSPVASPRRHASMSTKRIFRPWRRTQLILARIDSKEKEYTIIPRYENGKNLDPSEAIRI